MTRISATPGGLYFSLAKNPPGIKTTRFTVSLCLLLCLLPGLSGAGTENVAAASEQGSECVILLHGLARSAGSMEKMADRLTQAGYLVANIDYPSREDNVETLATFAFDQGLAQCKSKAGDSARVHVVTHSMGGILVRQYLRNHPAAISGRVVMLAPPNKGSEVVDKFRNLPGFEWLNGPAGRQLGTGSESVPRSLGAADFDVGIIAGTRSINLLLSQQLPNPDDGKVSVESARLEGMCDFMTVAVSHPFIMRNNKVIGEVSHYLANGSFNNSSTVDRDSLPAHCTSQ